MSAEKLHPFNFSACSFYCVKTTAKALRQRHQEGNLRRYRGSVEHTMPQQAGGKYDQ